MNCGQLTLRLYEAPRLYAAKGSRWHALPALKADLTLEKLPLAHLTHHLLMGLAGYLANCAAAAYNRYGR